MMWHADTARQIVAPLLPPLLLWKAALVFYVEEEGDITIKVATSTPWWPCSGTRCPVREMPALTSRELWVEIWFMSQWGNAPAPVPSLIQG